MIKSLPESPEPSDIGIETLFTVGQYRKNGCKFVDLVDICLERAKGIEPSYRAWEALVLPLNYARFEMRKAL